MKRWAVAILLLATVVAAWSWTRTPEPPPALQEPFRAPIGPPVFDHALDIA